MKAVFLTSKNLFRAKSFFKKLPWLLGRRAFWVILFFAFLSAVLGVFSYYNYTAKTREPEPKTSNDLLKFREDIYQKVLKQWELDDQELVRPQETEYSNPFIQ